MNTTVKAPVGSYITRDMLKKVVPSIFATEAHEPRSDSYVYIPSIEIIEAMLKEGFAPVMASQSRSRIPGKQEFTKHLVRFRHRNDIQQVAKVGETVNEVVLVNSHDGTSSYQLSAGVFRFVCSNGMVVPNNLVDEIRIPHRGNIRDNVIEATYRIIEEQDVIAQSIDTMRKVSLLPAEQNAFANSALALRYGRDPETNNILSPITAVAALQSRRSEDRQDDVWHVFNRLQENLVKGGIRGRNQAGNRTTTREVTGIDSLMGFNKELWMLADSMVALKGRP